MLEGAAPAVAGDLSGRTLGHFAILEKIGEGGFGSVYRAKQSLLDRPAVVKVLHTRHRATAIVTERFLREARLASRLDHPYAAHIYAFGAEPDGLLWLAMELVRGTTLDEYLRANGPLPVEKFVPLLERICEVIHSAHEQGIVHRDIKPANVMVVSRAGRLLPKLLDFGIAKTLTDESVGGRAHAATGPLVPVRDDDYGSGDTVETPDPDAGLTQRGAVIGSPHYMAPEQWVDAAAVDGRTDLYALGILAYEALTGAPPYKGNTVFELARAHASGELPAVPEPLPRALDAAFARALAREPEERFGNALEMAAAFRAAAGLADEPKPLPQLDDPVRERCLAHAPQPLAEAVAALDAARNPRQARDAVWLCAATLSRYLGVLALAARSRLGPARDASTTSVLRRIGSSLISDDDWLAVLHAMLRGHADRPDLHPVPELVMFICAAGGEPGPGAVRLRELAALHAELEDAGADDEAMRTRLAKALAVLSALLRDADFVCDYPLVVPAGDGSAEQWTGVRRNRRSALPLLGPAVQAGQPIVVDRGGSPVLSLFPLLQVRPPAPGAANETFMYAGRSERGGKLVAPPFEAHDDAVIEWIRLQLATTLDDVAQASVEDRPPYRGLEAFTADDAHLFVGRERQVEAFVNRVRVQPLLAVVGASGAGKSSFVQAGVIPALGDSWRSLVLRPGTAPLATLRARFPAVNDLTRLGEHLRVDAAVYGPMVIVVDQLEELFTLSKSDDDRAAFAAALAGAARSADDPVRVIFTLRDDFLVRAEALPALRDRLANSLQLLAIPARDDLERIVVEPARRAGYELEDPELAGRMVAEVADQPGALALLSFTAARLWELRDRHFRRLPTRAYEAIGGVGGALAKHAETLLEAMTREEQRLVREVFRNLVTSEGTRAIVTRPELASVLGGGATAQAVIERLVGSRLIVASEGDGDEQIEVAHEALLDAWPRLVEWRREDSEGARLRDQLRAAARQWHDRGRPRGLLWRDEALAEYQLWRPRYPGALGAIESAFAAASVSEAARGRRIRNTIIATVIALLAIGLVVLYRASSRAEEARGRAHERLLDLNVEQGRQALLAKDPMRALAYLSKAYSAGARGPDLAFMIARAAADLDTQQAVLDHGGVVRDVAYAPDGKTIVTAGAAGARVWDAGGRLRHVLAHEARVWQLAMFASGTRVVTASDDKTARVWDVASGEVVHRLVHADGVFSVRASPDGTRIATGCRDNTVRLWDAATGKLVATLTGHAELPIKLAFDRTGARLLSVSADETGRIWDVATGAAIATLAGHTNWVADGQFSADGTTIATASIDSTARLWDAATGKLVRTLQHFHPLHSVEFSADGEQLVTSSEDHRATVWNVATGEPVLTLLGHTDILTGAHFSPDGRQILTHGADGTVRLWDAATGAPLLAFVGHTNIVQAAVFDPSGAHIVTGSSDGTARIWDAHATQQVARADGESDEVAARNGGSYASRFALDRDGNVLVASETGAATVRSLGDGHVLRRATARGAPAQWLPDGRLLVLAPDGARVGDALLPRTAAARTAVAARDGSRIVLTYPDRPAELWQLVPARRIASLAGTRGVLAIAFSPDGTQLATASTDARLWSATTGQPLRPLEGHTPALNHLAWSADGRRIAGGGSDKTARVWDARTGLQLAVLQGHIGEINSVAFHPDGVLLATTSVDETAKVWNSVTGSQLASYSFLATVGWAAFSSDGARMITVTVDDTERDPPSFQIWSVAVDHRSPEDLAAYVRCRVPLAFQHERLVPASTSCR